MKAEIIGNKSRVYEIISTLERLNATVLSTVTLYNDMDVVIEVPENKQDELVRLSHKVEQIAGESIYIINQKD